MGSFSLVSNGRTAPPGTCDAYGGNAPRGQLVESPLPLLLDSRLAHLPLGCLQDAAWALAREHCIASFGVVVQRRRWDRQAEICDGDTRHFAATLVRPPSVAIASSRASTVEISSGPDSSATR